MKTRNKIANKYSTSSEGGVEFKTLRSSRDYLCGVVELIITYAASVYDSAIDVQMVKRSLKKQRAYRYIIHTKNP